MRIDPRNLGCHVSAKTHHATAQLIHDFKHTQVRVTSTPGKKRLNELEQRRPYQLVAVGHQEIQDAPTHHLDLQRLPGEDIFNIFRKNPRTHVLRPITTGKSKTRGAYLTR